MPNSSPVRIAVAAAASLLVAGACAGPAGAAGWSPAVPNLPGGSSTTFTGGAEVDGTGTVATTWLDFDNKTIRAAVKPPGGNFSAPQTLGLPGDRSPVIALDGKGNAVAAWEQSTGGIAIAERKAGSTFGSLGIVAAAGDHPSIGFTADGTGILAWSRDTQAMASVRPPGGTFAAPIVIGQGAGSVGSVKVATNPASGDAVVAWGTSLGKTTTAQSSFRPAGGGFAGQQQADSATFPTASHAFVSQLSASMGPNGRLELAWTPFGVTGQLSSDDLLKVASRPPGAASTWGSAKQVDNTSGDVFGEHFEAPQALALDSGAGRTVWQFRDGIAGVTAVRTASHASGGVYSAYSTAASASTPSTQVRRVAATTLPGNRALGLWTVGDVVVGAKATGTAAFGPTGVIPSGAGTVDEITVGTSGTGDAAAVVTRNGAQFVARYDATAPELRNVVIPATAIAGKPVTFSAAAFDALTSASSPKWDYGDGATATGKSVAHAFAKAGTFTVKVSTTDTAGNLATKSSKVTVAAAQAPAPAPAAAAPVPTP